MKHKKMTVIDVTPAATRSVVAYQQKPQPQQTMLQQWLPPSFPALAHDQGVRGGTKKVVGIVNAATGESHPVVLTKGSRAQQVLRTLGFPSEVILRRAQGNEPFSANDDLFEQLAHKEIVFVASPVVAGATSAVAQAVAHAQGMQEQRAMLDGVVNREEQPYWQEQKWRKVGSCYHGYFKTKYGIAEGEIHQRFCGFVEPHIFLSLQNQEQLRRHPKWMCFYPEHDRPGWCRVNLMVQTADPSSAILEIENIMVESYERAS
jgi:hypothetical protein